MCATSSRNHLQNYYYAKSATMVCKELGLPRHAEFISMWTAPSNQEEWLRLFGSEPKVQTGRKVSADELKLRLAGYLRIKPPREVTDRVLDNLDGDSSSLSSIDEGQEGEEKVEAPIPAGSVHVSPQKPPPKSVHVPPARKPRKKTSSKKLRRRFLPMAWTTSRMAKTTRIIRQLN